MEFSIVFFNVVNAYYVVELHLAQKTYILLRIFLWNEEL